MAFTNNMFLYIEPFNIQIQELEFVFKDLRLKRDIDNSEGQQLDNLGEILDVTRTTGETDSIYRIRLKIKVILNKSSGEAETIIAFVKILTDSSVVEYREEFPAGVVIYANFDGSVLIGDVLPDARQLIEPVLAAGVRLKSLIFVDSTQDFFNFGDEGAEVTDGKGFSELGYPVADIDAGALTEKG